MRVINAGIGDLGQSRSQGEMGAGAGAAAIAVNTAGRMDDAGNNHFQGTLQRKSEAAAKKARNESEKNANGQPPRPRMALVQLAAQVEIKKNPDLNKIKRDVFDIPFC